jgi:hypothetical protein
MIEVEVNSIRVSLMNQQRVVVLKDINDDRYLPIWIGQFEADAITIELQENRSIKRPLTHDLLKSTIEELGATVDYVFINDMRNNIFYARLVLDVDGETLEIDSRPSDAIAVAVRARAPIFVSEMVMDRSAVEPDESVELEAGLEDEIDNLEEEQRAAKASEAAKDDDTPADDQDFDEEEVDESQLNAFTDFVNSLDLDLDDDDDKN